MCTKIRKYIRGLSFTWSRASEEAPKLSMRRTNSNAIVSFSYHILLRIYLVLPDIHCNWQCFTSVRVSMCTLLSCRQGSFVYSLQCTTVQLCVFSVPSCVQLVVDNLNMFCCQNICLVLPISETLSIMFSGRWQICTMNAGEFQKYASYMVKRTAEAKKPKVQIKIYFNSAKILKNQKNG